MGETSIDHEVIGRVELERMKTQAKITSNLRMENGSGHCASPQQGECPRGTLLAVLPTAVSS